MENRGQWSPPQESREYKAAVKNIYSILPYLPVEHNKVINNWNTTFQGMKVHNYELEGLTHSNAVLNSSNSSVMA